MRSSTSDDVPKFVAGSERTRLTKARAFLRIAWNSDRLVAAPGVLARFRSNPVLQAPRPAFAGAGPARAGAGSFGIMLQTEPCASIDFYGLTSRRPPTLDHGPVEPGYFSR